MDEAMKFWLLLVSIVGVFALAVVGLETWANYETAKLGYLCIPE